MFFFFSSRRRHTRLQGDWSSDVCSSDLDAGRAAGDMRDKRLLVDQQAVNPVSETREFWRPLRIAPFHHPALRNPFASQPAAVEVGTSLGADREIELPVGCLYSPVTAKSGIRECLGSGLRERIADEAGLRVGRILVGIERE